MRIIFLTTAFLLAITALIAQDKNITYVEKDFAAAQIRQLEASTSGGWVNVEGGNQSKATVSVILRPNGKNKSKGKDLIAIFEREYDLDLTVRNGVLVAKAKRKDDRGNSPLSVSLRITVPKAIASDINTSGGSITLNNLQGNQHFRTAGGSLTLTQLSGNIQGQTAGGSIHLENSQGEINLKTAGGSIKLDQVSGQVNIGTSGGSITAKTVSGSLTANTSGGSISLQDCEGNIKAGTSGGSINASIQKITESLTLSTSGGSVKIQVPKGAYDLNLKGSRVVLAEGSFQGNKAKQSVRGSINGGGYPITATTSAGSVTLSWL